MSGCQVDDCDQPATHRAFGEDVDMHPAYTVEIFSCDDDLGRAVVQIRDRYVVEDVHVDPYVEPAR